MAALLPYAMVASTALGGAAAIKSLTSKPPAAPKVTPMPDANSPDAEAARRRMIASQAAQSGRASTVLSQDKLGG